MTSDPTPRSRRALTAILLTCLLVSLAFAAYPMYVIRPFRAQGARELALALVAARYRTSVTLVSALVALAALAAFWRRQPFQWRSALAPAAAALVCALAVLAHINVYEIMFHPLGRPSFSSARDSKLDNREMVIAVKMDGIARAYPIRDLAYHHIANDVLGKTAIVATY